MLNPAIARKIFHLIAVFLAAISPLIISEEMYLVILGIMSLIFSYFAISKDLLPSIHDSGNKSWGIFFFPLAYTIGLLITEPRDYWIFLISFFILAFSDSLAAITGELFARKYFRLTSDKKSFLGSLVFFLITFIILFLMLTNVVSLPLDESRNTFEINRTFLLGITCLAILLTLIEAISSRGLDNFLIPFFSFFLITMLFKDYNYILLHNFVVGMLLSFMIVIISLKFKFLTPDGAVSVFILATIIYSFGSWKWTVPILTFFVFSSLLSKYRSYKNHEIENVFEKSGKRDHMQVMANGLFAAVMVILNTFYHLSIFYTLYVASVAAVCADTWATEIGTIRNARTYNILSLKPVSQGTSGGISYLGTFGGILGAFIISLSGVIWLQTENFTFITIIIISGIAGSTIDSILGATIQAQFRCDICGKITEKQVHCFQKSKMYKGYSWVNNDWVNFFASLTGGLTSFIIIKVFR